MTFADINKAYSKKVAKWLGRGYWVNAGTMGGSQGEIAHVDLTNGQELLRVLMDRETEYNEDDDWREYDIVHIVVGRVPASERVQIGISRELGNTVWNDKLEVIDEVKFYQISRKRGGWYGTKKEADAQRDKQRARRESRRGYVPKDRVFKGMEQKMLTFVRREVIGCKTAKAKDITKVEKVYNTDWNGNVNGVSYYVTVKGKRVKLGGRELQFANAR